MSKRKFMALLAFLLLIGLGSHVVAGVCTHITFTSLNEWRAATAEETSNIANLTTQCGWGCQPDLTPTPLNMECICTRVRDITCSAPNINFILPDDPFAGCYSSFEGISLGDLPDYLDISPAYDNCGQPNVVVRYSEGECVPEVIPAKLSITHAADYDYMVRVGNFHNSRTSLDFTKRMAYAERKVQYFYKVVYDPNVFRIYPGLIDSDYDNINGAVCLNPNIEGDFITVSLVAPDCETLLKSKNLYVSVVGYKLQEVMIDRDSTNDMGQTTICVACTGDVYPYQRIYQSVGEVARIGVVFEPAGFINNYCNDPNQPPPCKGGCGSKGCSGSGGGVAPMVPGNGGNTGGACGGDPPPCIQLGRISQCVRPDLDNTQAYQAAVAADGSVATNWGGYWSRTNAQPGWSATNSFSQYQSNPDRYKINITVTDPTGYTYNYERTNDSWTAAADSTRAYAETYNSNTKVKLLNRQKGTYTAAYDYDGTGDNETLVRVRDNLGTLSYSYNSGKLTSMSAASGGASRLINLEYDLNRKLTKVYGCSSCGTKEYEYTTSAAPAHAPIIAQQKLNGDTLVNYTYTSGTDSFNGQYLGEGTDNPVLKWVRNSAANSMTRQEYIDASQYRAKVYCYDNTDSLTQERHYHNLQSGDNLLGDYSATNYAYEIHNGVFTKTTTYPNGNTAYRLTNTTDTSRSVTTQWGSLNSNLAQQRSQSLYNRQTTAGEGYKDLLDKQINRYGGTTTYIYGSEGGYSDLVAYRTDPAVNNASQIYNYEYDGERQLTLEYHADANEDNVSTAYAYDDYGRMTRQIDGLPSAGQTTYYVYTPFNELSQTISPAGSTTEYFYDGYGVKTAQAVHLGSTASTVAAEKYLFDGKGQLTQVQKAKDNGTFTFDGNFNSWINEKYDYDAYGRRTAVIADLGGANLTTAYEYNNQSELVKTIQPDNRFVLQVRDGRGLVKYEITGAGTTNVGTTEFRYDANSNLTRKIDPAQVTEVYQYDACDRMTQSARRRVQ